MLQTEIRVLVHWGFQFFGSCFEERNSYVKHSEERSEGKRVKGERRGSMKGSASKGRTVKRGEGNNLKGEEKVLPKWKLYQHSLSMSRLR